VYLHPPLLFSPLPCTRCSFPTGRQKAARHLFFLFSPCVDGRTSWGRSWALPFFLSFPSLPQVAFPLRLCAAGFDFPFFFPPDEGEYARRSTSTPSPSLPLLMPHPFRTDRVPSVFSFFSPPFRKVIRERCGKKGVHSSSYFSSFPCSGLRASSAPCFFFTIGDSRLSSPLLRRSAFPL